MRIALNGNSTLPYPFLLDIRVARETGHDGLIVVADKLRRYLAAGYTARDARAALNGLPVLGLSNVWDIERATPDGRAALLSECEEACALAAAIGCSSVQLLTGPVDPNGPYRDPIEMDLVAVRRAATENLERIGEIGRGHGVGFYIEPLAWTPLRSLRDVMTIIDDAAQDNVGIAIDFWHLWSAGTEPAEVARLAGRAIRSVDVCDGLGPARTAGTADQRSRRVALGAGEIPLARWVDAVRSTGYDGTWSCELWSPPHWELDPWRTVTDMRVCLEELLARAPMKQQEVRD